MQVTARLRLVLTSRDSTHQYSDECYGASMHGMLAQVFV